MKVFILKIKEAFEKYHITNCILLALFANIIIELVSRKSLISLLSYIADRPFVFCYNTIIILFTLLPFLFFKRRKFFYMLLSFVWIGFGIANGIILIFRTTPLTASDLLLISSAIDVLNKYFSVAQIWIFGILFAVLLIFVIYICIRVLIKAGKNTEKTPYLKYAFTFLLTGVILYASTKFGVYTGRLAVNFGNIADAFKEYGFPYCFTNSIINTGIDKPDDYSEEVVIGLRDEIHGETETKVQTNTVQPETEHVSEEQLKMPGGNVNIIFLQLESFFDVKYLKNITLSANPLPIFQTLKNNYSSGFVRVPSIGAGTANTEFEMITGMNIDFFGPGEYPYKTILQNNTCESYPYVLKDKGYATHAIHNNTASFYDRDVVFKNLGFDTFTSIEYMNVQEFTPNGWAKDYYLTEAIMDCLNSTVDTADYIYTISVQAHGKYPEVIDPDMYEIMAYNEDKSINPQYTYYVNQLREVDKFIGELVKMLSDFDEKVVLVMYGDHLPSLGIENSTLKNGDIFQTEYIIWNNFELENTNKNLEAYQLGAHVFEKLDINDGILSAYHQLFSKNDNYLDRLEIIQYDMLYGDNDIYEGNTPYLPTEMKMGIKEIVIENIIIKDDGSVYVRGKNFNKYSIVNINGTDVETEFIDSEILRVVCEPDEINEIEVITVGQGTFGSAKISISNEYIVAKQQSYID